MRVMSILLVTCLSAAALAEEPAAGPAPSTASTYGDHAVDVVERYILAFLGPLRDVRWRRVPFLARTIVDAASRYGLDPLLVAVVVRYESSYWEARKGATRGRGRHKRPADPTADPLLGAKGEKGLMQVWGSAASGCDLSTAEGQLDCGCRWLASRIASCDGDIACGLSRYQGKTCEEPTRGRRPPPCGPRLRYAEWQRALAEAAVPGG